MIKSINELHISVSNGNSKTGAIPAFNTLPTDDFVTLKDGTRVTDIKGTCAGVCDNCKGECYALSAAKRYKTARNAWENNTRIVRDNPRLFVKEMLFWLGVKKPRYFRIHVSGEFETDSIGNYSREFEHWIYIARCCPETLFYCYTKQSDMVFETECCLAERGEDMPRNIIVNHSLWCELPKAFKGHKVFVCDDGTNEEIAALPHCPAINAPADGKKYGTPNHKATCEKCRLCMNPKVKAVACYLHR